MFRIWAPDDFWQAAQPLIFLSQPPSMVVWQQNSVAVVGSITGPTTAVLS
jgi:hypothetical protein